MGPGHNKAVRIPLVMIPGWSDGPRPLAPLRARFRSAGWREETLATVSFRDRTGSNREHAEEIAEVVGALRRVTGEARVGIIAHSMGGLATRLAMSEPEFSGSVAGAAFLGTPHAGTWVAYLGWGEGAREMRPRSEFLLELEGREWPREVPSMDLWTPLETHVLPQRSARRPGVPQARIPRALHWWMPRSPETFRQLHHFFLGLNP